MQRPIPDRKQLVKLYLHDKKTLQQIGSKYGFSGNTVGKWLKMHDIPTRPSSPQFDIKRIKGQLHKTCRGPSHKEQKYIPLDRFHKRPDGMPRGECMVCESFRHNSEPLQDFTPFYQGRLESIVNRLGVMEASRRLQISQPALWNLRHPRRGVKIKARTARSILLLLQELNASKEVRHKKSIRYGAYLRGKPEREVISAKDLYKKDGDQEAERGRSRREAEKLLSS